MRNRTLNKNLPAIWEGETAYIVGSGYSVIEQFNIPYSIYQQIANGEEDINVLNTYLIPYLAGKPTIGVNLSGLIGPVIDVLYFRDCNFYDDYRARIKWDFKGGLRYSSCTKQELGSEVTVLNSPNKGKSVTTGITTEPGAVCWNYDSGAAAINLAVQFGAKKIVLIGYDMSLGPNGEQRWHGEHQKSDNRATGQPFKRMLPSYRNVAKDAKQLGVEIVNANPWSKIDVFPRMNLKEIL